SDNATANHGRNEPGHVAAGQPSFGRASSHQTVSRETETREEVQQSRHEHGLDRGKELFRERSARAEKCRGAYRERDAGKARASFHVNAECTHWLRQETASRGLAQM